MPIGEEGWPTFYAYGPYEIKKLDDGSFDYKSFWKNAKDTDDWGDEPGCYLICRLARRRLRALYIGKTNRSLRRRIYEHRRMISDVMKDLGRNTKLSIIMIHYYKERGKWNSNAIEALETELINIAMRNKIKINNIQKTNAKKVRIAGVLHSSRGENSKAAPSLRLSLGMKK